MSRALLALLLLTPALVGCLGGSDDPIGVTDADAARGGIHVVIGVRDGGINPYHEAFRDGSEEAYEHPSTYIDGYPEDAPALNLTLDASSYEEAIAADEHLWGEVETGQLYWIPGTNIIGAIAPSDSDFEEFPSLFCQPILDCTGHGTAVTSRAGTEDYGLCGECKIVAAQGARGVMHWVTEQPWIDTWTSAWTETDFPRNVGNRSEHAEIMARKPAFLSSGNGLGSVAGIAGQPSATWTHQGAPEAIVVGGHDNGRVILWPGSMPNLVADACLMPVAHHESLTADQERCGTSFSAPFVAGAGGNLILEARRALGDHTGGIHDRVLAQGDADLVEEGPLADGELTADELERLLLTTADPRPPEGASDGEACEPTNAANNVDCALGPALVEWGAIPDGVPAYYFIGYGAVNEDTLEHTKAVLRGEEPMPERPVEDAFFALDQEVREALVEVDP